MAEAAAAAPAVEAEAAGSGLRWKFGLLYASFYGAGCFVSSEDHAKPLVGKLADAAASSQEMYNNTCVPIGCFHSVARRFVVNCGGFLDGLNSDDEAVSKGTGQLLAQCCLWDDICVDIAAREPTVFAAVAASATRQLRNAGPAADSMFDVTAAQQRLESSCRTLSRAVRAPAVRASLSEALTPASLVTLFAAMVHSDIKAVRLAGLHGLQETWTLCPGAVLASGMISKTVALTGGGSASEPFHQFRNATDEDNELSLRLLGRMAQAWAEAPPAAAGAGAGAGVAPLAAGTVHPPEMKMMDGGQEQGAGVAAVTEGVAPDAAADAAQAENRAATWLAQAAAAPMVMLVEGAEPATAADARAAAAARAAAEASELALLRLQTRLPVPTPLEEANLVRPPDRRRPPAHPQHSHQARAARSRHPTVRLSVRLTRPTDASCARTTSSTVLSFPCSTFPFPCLLHSFPRRLSQGILYFYLLPGGFGFASIFGSVWGGIRTSQSKKVALFSRTALGGAGRAGVGSALLYALLTPLMADPRAARERFGAQLAAVPGACDGVRAVAGDRVDDVTAGAVVADVGAVAAVALVNLLLPYSVVASLVNPLVLLEPNNAGW